MLEAQHRVVDGAVGAVAQQPPGVDEVPHHAPLVGEGLREVPRRAVQLAAAAAHAVDHLCAARPQAYHRVYAELGHVLLALGPRGVHALQRAPQRRRVHVAPRGDGNRFRQDCLALQQPFAERPRELEALRHPDGTPVYRVEETKPLLGSRALRMEAERPKQRRWNGVDDPISHCLAGNSLLLTGLPGTGKTHLARTIVARLREQGEAVHLVSKTHCSAQNLGLGAQTADHWVRRYVRGGSAQKLDWLVVEEITQLDMALWADLACVGLNADVKFLLLGDFR